MTFKTIEEVIERANTTFYGLAAGVCTRDIGTGLKMANELDAGTVWINCYDNFDMACPFGGTKESGWGREKGEYALENYTNVKCVLRRAPRVAQRPCRLNPSPLDTAPHSESSRIW